MVTRQSHNECWMPRFQFTLRVAWSLLQVALRTCQYSTFSVVHFLQLNWKQAARNVAPVGKSQKHEHVQVVTSPFNSSLSWGTGGQYALSQVVWTCLNYRNSVWCTLTIQDHTLFTDVKLPDPTTLNWKASVGWTDHKYLSLLLV